MSHIRVCDFCGKERSKWSPRWESCKIKLYSKNGLSDFSYRRLDACPSCLDRMKMWILSMADDPR